MERPKRAFFDSVTGELTVTEYSDEEIAALEERTRLADLPKVITARQVRLLILEAKKTKEAEDKITKMGPEAKITWEYETQYNHGNELIIALAGLLNLTEEELFTKAAKL